MKNLFTALSLLSIVMISNAQVAKDSQLFLTLKKQDSIFFARGFNLCDIAYLEKTISKDLKFYHDQSGFQDRKTFLENTRRYICSDPKKKPIRKVEQGSLIVYPLHNNGTLYGAIQKGVHHFYIREDGKQDVWTSKANFTHVWVLENNSWKISEVLSYNHQSIR